MTHIKIYSAATTLEALQAQLSETIHITLVEILKLPLDKKFQRFFSMAEHFLIKPSDKSQQYLMIEILMLAGRTDATKVLLIESLISAIHQKCHIPLNDIEIVIIESPAANWGFRGQSATNIAIPYPIHI